MPEARCEIWDAGCEMRDMGCEMRDARYGIRCGILDSDEVAGLSQLISKSFSSEVPIKKATHRVAFFKKMMKPFTESEG
jgi:hypothetical protein